MINVDLFTFIEWLLPNFVNVEFNHYLIKSIQTSPSKIATYKPFDVLTHNTVNVLGTVNS